MIAFIYFVIGMLSTVWMNQAKEQKEIKRKVTHFVLSAILLAVSMLLFINELSDINFIKFMNLS